MGSAHSKKNSRKSFSYPNLDQKYVDEVQTIFSKTKKGMTRSDFVNWQNRMGEFAGLIFDAFSSSGVLNEKTFLEVSSKLRGNADDKASILLKIHGSTTEILKAVSRRFSQMHNAENGDALLQFLRKNAPTDNSDRALYNYLLSHRLAISLIRSVYVPICNEAPNLLPTIDGSSSIITSACSLVVLNAYLPIRRRQLWTLLFSSAQHGSSFSQLQKRINGEGPCLVVIKSTDDHIFGCFASDGFLNGPLYRGDATCFLFELAPELNVFPATGMVDEYAYFNSQQETMPNGLGIGGTHNVWPLFIDEEYGKGICCSTVAFEGLPCLAGKATFKIKEMEVFRVGLKRVLSEEEIEQIQSKSKSIIDKDPVAKALLEMSGRKMHSEGYRQPAD